MPAIDQYLRGAVDQGASDLHVAAESPVYYRILGILKPVDGSALPGPQVESLIRELIGDAAWSEAQEKLEIDTSYTLDTGDRFRINVFRERKGWNLVARHFSKAVRGIAELGLPEILHRFADSNQGLILLTGPGRSGKSTTAAALIDYINVQREDHIITIEDPIEYLHARKNCLVNQRSVGPHTCSFAAALRSALREDPDIILVGEMRDTETMSLALTAAETGHLVIGTLHTNSAAATIARVINLFPAAERSQATTSLAESLVGIVSQRLIPSKGGGKLVPAFEVLVNTVAISNTIVTGEFHKLPSLIATGAMSGMMTLASSLKTLLDKGGIDQAQMDELLAEEI